MSDDDLAHAKSYNEWAEALLRDFRDFLQDCDSQMGAGTFDAHTLMKWRARLDKHFEINQSLAMSPTAHVDESVRETVRYLRGLSDFNGKYPITSALMKRAADLLESLAARLAEADAACEWQSSGEHEGLTLKEVSTWFGESQARNKGARASQTGRTVEELAEAAIADAAIHALPPHLRDSHASAPPAPEEGK